jgi:hypothetical protein
VSGGYWKVDLVVTDRGFAQIGVAGEIRSKAELSFFIAKLEAVAKFLPDKEEQSA